MGKWRFRHGLHELGNGCWAYLQPDGSWGWSNSGFITDGETAVLVDTLFDLKQTADMLATLRATIPAAASIDILVNTHADADHTFGNQLVKDARIIATQGTLQDFHRVDPQLLQKICLNAEQFGSAGLFMRECFRPFDFSGIELTPPNETFSDKLDLMVGDKQIQLIEMGPAHSLGDALIYVPDDRIVYAGDLLFNEGTPIAWDGPFRRWIDACEYLLAMDVDIIIPGHGPIAGKDDVRRMRDYLIHVAQQARPLYEAGMDYLQAAYAIDLDDYRDWKDAERIVVTMQTLFDDFAARDERPQRLPAPFFAEMKSYRHHLERWAKDDAHCSACAKSGHFAATAVPCAEIDR